MMAIDVVGELSVVGGGGDELRLTGSGAVVTLELPSLGVGRALARSSALGRAQRVKLITRLHAGLRLADVTLQVAVAGRPVAQLAPGSEAGLLSRLLGLGAFEIRPKGLLLVLLGR
jgi:hypothetical protein